MDNNYINPTHQEFGNPKQIQQSVGENNFQSNNDDMLLKAYIGKNADKIMKGGWSWCAFLLNEFYCLYRKMWLLGIIVIIAPILVNRFFGNITSFIVILILRMLWGFIFNEAYLSDAKDKIAKIKKDNPNMNTGKLTQKCKEKGGTSVSAIIIVLFLCFLPFLFLIMIFKIGVLWTLIILLIASLFAIAQLISIIRR